MYFYPYKISANLREIFSLSQRFINKLISTFEQGFNIQNST